MIEFRFWDKLKARKQYWSMINKGVTCSLSDDKLGIIVNLRIEETK